MPSERKRIVEVRMIVNVLVDLSAAILIEVLAASGQPSSVADVVSFEVASHLEAVPCVEAAIVNQL
jgi:hypothetical protein